MAQETQPNDSIHNSEQGVQDGLTKREYFAAMAMQGLIARGTHPIIDNVTHNSVVYADSLIEALNK